MNHKERVMIVKKNNNIIKLYNDYHKKNIILLGVFLFL